MKIQQLLERFERPENKSFGQFVNLANKATATLSWEARHAIEGWEISNWLTGALAKGYRNNDAIIQEINRAFEPCRAKLRELFGDTIRLYRGQRKHSPDPELEKDRQLYSYTFDGDIASDFAYGTAHRKLAIPSVEDIKKAVGEYNRTGFVKFGRHKYKRIQGSKYYNIYDVRNNFITDGDNLEKSLMDDRARSIEYDEEDRQKADVYTVDVPVDKIVWFTNRAKSKEFIVAMSPK